VRLVPRASVALRYVQRVTEGIYGQARSAAMSLPPAALSSYKRYALCHREGCEIRGGTGERFMRVGICPIIWLRRHQSLAGTALRQADGVGVEGDSEACAARERR